MSVNLNGIYKTMEKNKGKKALDASITVRVSGPKKKEFEEICENMGMTVSTAINAFVEKVINLKALPFAINGYKRKRKLFIAEGKYDISDDILLNDDISDEDWKRMDEEIVEMFENDDEYKFFN